MQQSYIAVVGAANVDIGGFSSKKILARDSNPGRVRLSMGGVGRNIACNLARMGIPTRFVTALGGDAHAALIREDCARAGLDISHAQTFPDEATSTYLFVADADGDMHTAINDMGILGRLTPEALQISMPLLNGALLVVLDANLPLETLEYLAQALRVPIFADPVSAAKASKLRGILPHLSALKPNRLEAELLTGLSVTDARSARQAAEKLISTGLKRAFITLGTDGVCCADEQETLFLPGRQITMRNATGAGDAFTAALAWAYSRGLPLKDMALAGMAAASIAVASLETVSPEMCGESLMAALAQMNR